jgi:two-component system, LytTR family, sensor kinase
MHSSATDGFCQRWMGEKEPHKLVKLYFHCSLTANRMTLGSTIKKTLLQMASTRAIRHTLFWVVLFVLFSMVEVLVYGQPFFYTLSNNLVRLFFLGLAVYYNVYRLIPKYLADKRFLKYVGLLLLTVFVVTPLEVFVIYIKSGNYPEIQVQVLENLNFQFIPNIFVLSTSTVVKITIDWYTNIREKQELVTETMQSELRFLKSQINPHFLFNTLNSLYALTLKKSDLAPDIVLKLSEMMRYMLYECNEKWVPLSKEVNYIANYLELERIRQGSRVDIKYEVKGLLGNQKIAPLMFIPFIENCFKHGLGSQISKGFVNIYLDVQGNEIDLQIENSKTEALPKQLHPRSGGIGLVNVRRRLELLYPNRYMLQVVDSPTTYTVKLKMRLEEDN